MATADGTVRLLQQETVAVELRKLISSCATLSEGMEIYSLYAHLSAIQPGIKNWRRGQSRTKSSPRWVGRPMLKPILKERAHVHFELNVLINDNFASWSKRLRPANAMIMANGTDKSQRPRDPRQILLAEQFNGTNFSLPNFIAARRTLPRAVSRDGIFRI